MIGFQNKLDISISIVVKNHSGNIGLRYFHLRFGSKYSNEKKNLWVQENMKTFLSITKMYFFNKVCAGSKEVWRLTGAIYYQCVDTKPNLINKQKICTRFSNSVFCSFKETQNN